MANGWEDVPGLKAAPVAPVEAGSAWEPVDLGPSLEGAAQLSVDLSPADAIDADRLSRKLGVSRQTVAQNLPYARKIEKVPNLEELRRRAPVLSGKAQTDAWFLSAMADETGKFVTAEEKIRNYASSDDYKKDFGWPARRVHDVKRGALGVKQGFQFARATELIDTSRTIAESMAALDAGDTQKGVDLYVKKFGASRVNQHGFDPAAYAALPPEGKAAARKKMDAYFTGEAISRVKSGIDAAAAAGKIPRNPLALELAQSKGFIEVMRGIGKDPAEMIFSLTAESLPASVPSLAAGALTGGLGMVPMMIGTGLASYKVDEMMSAIDALDRAGVKTDDSKAVIAALSDPKMRKKIDADAAKHAVPVALFDALSAGLAGKVFAPRKALAAGMERAATKGGRTALRAVATQGESSLSLPWKAANMGAQVGLQGTLGAAGEAGGQLASGQELDWYSIVAEALGEVGGAPVEVANAARAKVSDTLRDKQSIRQAEQAQKDLADVLSLDESKLIAGSPDAVAEHISNVAKVEGMNGVFLQTDRIVDEFSKQGLTLDDAAAWVEKMGGDADLFHDAVESGAAVQLDVGKVAVGIKNDENMVLFQNDLTKSPEFPSGQDAANAAEVERLSVERIEELMQSAKDQLIVPGDEDIFTSRFVEEVVATGQYTRPQAEKMGALIRARANNLAKRTGISAKAHLERMGISVEASTPAEFLRRFGSNAKIHFRDEMIENAKLDFKGRQNEGLPLTDRLAQLGRIKLRKKGEGGEPFAEIQGLESGLAPFFTTKGRSGGKRTYGWDDAIKTLHTEGYFGNADLASLTLADLTDLIQRDQAAKKDGSNRIRPFGANEFEIAREAAERGYYEQAAAWHGSPHTFDKFTTAAMGTGEGAQAYGWGLYFAESKGVAKHYRDMLAKQDIVLVSANGDKTTLKKGTDEAYAAFKVANEGSVDAAIRAEKEKLKNPQYPDHFRRAAESEMAIMQKWKDDGVSVSMEKSGRLYKVELAPAEDEYLLWDKPLSEQSEKVKAALAEAVKKIDPTDQKRIADNQDSASGAFIYNALGMDTGSGRAASEYLHSLGIRGIKYLDGASRRKGEGNYNYVIFSDDDVAIEAMFQNNASRVPRGAVPMSGLNVIGVFESANLSTILHELGHVFVKDMELVAAEYGVGVEDLAAMKKWAGVDKNGEITRKGHEKLARAFEAYLREGKAPNEELRGAFRTFRRWMMDIYRSVLDLDVKLDDEVRGIFDRMLATEEEIAAMKESTADLPLLDEQAMRDAGMTEDEIAEYRRLAVAADEETLDAMLDHRMGGRGERLAAWDKKIESEYAEQPGVVAAKAITDGGNTVERDSIVAILGEEKTVEAEAKHPGLISPEGIDIAQAAAMTGNESGFDLAMVLMSSQDADTFRARRMNELEALYDATQDIHETVRNSASKKMRTKESNVLRKLIDKAMGVDKKRQTEAEYRNRWEIAEERMKAAITAGKSQAEIDKLKAEAKAAKDAFNAGMKELQDQGKTTKADRPIAAEALKNWAKQQTAAAKVGAATTVNHLVTNGRNLRKKVLSAVKKGDFAAALDHNERLRINDELVSEHYRAMRRLEKMRDRWARALDALVVESYRNQINRVLSLHNMVTRKSEFDPATDTLRQFIDGINRANADYGADMVVLPEWVLDSAGSEWSALTWEQVNDLDEVVKFLVGRGQAERKQLLSDQQTTVTEAAEECASEMDGRDTAKVVSETSPRLRAVQDYWRSFVANTALLRNIFADADGFKVGANTRRLFDRITAGVDYRNELKDEVGKLLKPHLEVVKSFLRKHEGVAFSHVRVPFRMAEDGRIWTAERIFMVALNMGNAQNLNRVMDGYGMGEEELIRLTSILTEEEWAAVEGIWKGIDALYPRLNEVHRRINFFSLKKVASEPITVRIGDNQTKTLSGGYFPIRYDFTLSQLAAEEAEKEDLLNRNDAILQRPVPKAGMTKGRQAGGGGRPVLLNLGVISQHVEDVCNYIALAEAVRDVDRITRNERYQQEAIRVLGKHKYDMIRPALKETVRPENISMTRAESLLERTRAKAAIYVLWMNLRAFAVQPFQFPQGARMAGGWGHYLKGVRLAMSGGATGAESVYQMSAYMRSRRDNMDADIRKKIDTLKPEPEIAGMTRQDLVDFGMAAYRVMDSTHVIPTWLGTYHRVLEENGGDQKAAVKEADRAVRTYSPSGMPIDKSQFARMKTAWGMFSFLGTFRIAQGNMMREAYGAWQLGNISRMEYFSIVLHDIILPTSLSTLFFALAGKGELPDWEDWFSDQVSATVQGFPVLGDLANAVVWGATGGKGFSRDTVRAPSFAFVEKAMKAASATGKAMNKQDESAVKKAIWSVAEIVAFWYELPVTQVYKRIERGWKQFQEKDAPPTAIVLPATD